MGTQATYSFGKYQRFVSDKMRTRPGLSNAIYRIFGYTNLATWGRYLIFKDLLSKIPIQDFRHILDLGCGQGEFSFMLAEALPGASIDAIDTDIPAINKIKEVRDRFAIKNLHTYSCMVQEFGPEKDDYYDLIFSVDVFQHIPVDQMPFQACKKRLKPGGFLITKMPAKDHKRILPKKWFREFDDTLAGKNPEQEYMAHHGQVYGLAELTGRYEKEGFKVIYAAYSDGIIARAGWEFNYLMMKAGSIGHLISLPVSRLMMRLDRLLQKGKEGNVIQVIGQKPLQ